jgi:hypothetical protein
MYSRSAEEAYAEVKKLASDLSDDEHRIRSCIFDLHAAVELELRRILYHTFHAQLFLTDDEAQNERTVADLEKAIRRLGFMDMYRLLRPVLNSWPYPDFQAIPDINETRNQAAHGGDVSQVFYKGRNPFTDADAFAQMYFDVWAIKQCIPKFFWHAIEKPRETRKRYIKEYGSGLL